MRRIVTVILIILTCNNVMLAQATNNVNSNAKANYKIVHGQMYKQEISDDYSGSKYIHENFSNAVINNNSIKLRYNAYLDKMEIENDDELSYLDTVINQSIIFNDFNENYRFMKYNVKGVDIEGYLKILSESNKYKLYKIEKITLDEVKTGGAFSTETSDSNNKEYRRNEDVYLIERDGDFNILSKNVKKLSKLLKNNEIVEIVKENKLNLNKEQDLIKLVNFLNK